jgi:oligopeptide transport system substrate-binding protein
MFSGVFCLLLAMLIAGGCGKIASERANEMVTYGETARIRGFDPVKAGDVASALAIGQIYEGLVQYAYLARPYRVEPALAETLPHISEDGLIYTFKVRKGIYFQDDPCFTNSAGKGRELVAEDFVFSLKRLADIKNKSTGYWAFNDRIVGLDEFRTSTEGSKPADYTREVEGLRAPDRYTFQIKLKQPYPQLMWILTMQYAFAVPREATEYYGEEFVNHPVGTGPYRLKSWRRNYSVEFERNPKWTETGRKEYYPSEGEPGDKEAGLLADAGKEIPIIDRIVWYVIDDDSTQWLKFVTGEMESSNISRDNWDVVIDRDGKLTESLARKGVLLNSSPTLDLYYIGFNMDDPVVGKNRKLRQALSCAFNSKEWIRFWNGRVIRAKGPIPPGVAGFDDKPSPYPFDLERARILLAEAGYPDGKDGAGKNLQISVELGSADAQTRESVELTIDFMRKIGVILNPSYNNWPTYLGKLERRQCQMFWLGWVADYPDAENFLQLFCSKNCSTGPNHSNYVNPEFDKLYEKIRTMPDSPERTGIYKQMADIIAEDCPWIFMHHPMTHGLHHGWLRNYKPHDFPYGMSKYRRIDVDARREWQGTHGKEDWRK